MQEAPTLEIQIAFYCAAIVMFLIVVASPRRVFQTFVRGRIIPSSRTVLIYRGIGLISILAAISRLVMLLR